jgi:peroxiredoxin
MSIQAGQRAPSFSLYDSDKNKVSLADFAGKNVLLLFFPLAFTSVCTAELCSVRDNLARYNELNAEVLGISVDSLHTLKRFKQDQQLNFRLLSDFNKVVSAEYGSLYETFSFEMKGVSKRAAFVVDKNGIIRYAEVLENAGNQPDFNAIQQTLETVS